MKLRNPIIVLLAIAIMATIIITAYQKELEGWPRIASLRAYPKNR